MDDAAVIVIADDEGNEKAYQILFTFENEENGNQYVVVQDPDDEEEVYGFRYSDDGELALLDEEETAMVEEVLDAWDGEML